MQISDPEAGARWTGLAVGIGIAALIGVGALLLVFLRKRDQLPVNGVMGGAPMPVPFLYPAHWPGWLPNQGSTSGNSSTSTPNPPPRSRT